MKGFENLKTISKGIDTATENGSELRIISRLFEKKGNTVLKKGELHSAMESYAPRINEM